MTYVEDYARFVDALDREQDMVRTQRRERQELRRRLARLALICAVALALVGLGRTALDDVAIAGASEHQSFAEWYAASPENRFHYWYSSDERNASYFHIRQHFGHGSLGDTAVRIAQCESGLDPHARSRTNDHGVFQLNAPSWSSRFQQVTGQPWNPDVYHAEANARFARWLVNETGGWSHWACAR